MYHNYLYRLTSQEIDTFDPDLIHAIHINGRGAIEAGKDAGIPTVVSTHALDLCHQRMATMTLRRADTVHSVSNFTRSLTKDLVPDTNPYVVPPSIDVADYTAARDQYDEKPGKVTTIARLVDRKNISTVIRAWERVEASSDRGELLIIGDGPNRETLEKQASHLSSVQFTGWVDDEEKLRHLAESEVFVLVPRRFGYNVEGFGIVYIEAQAAGTPVIGSQQGGAPEAIGDGGIVVENESAPGNVAEPLQRLLSNAELRQQYRRQAQSRVTAFNIQSVARQHMNQYPKKTN